MMLPTVYKLTGKGSLQQWRTWVVGNVIWTERGKVGGKLQVSEEAIKEGKNAGRANATTPEQQAEAEATSRWTKKVERQGYVPELERAEKGETNAGGGIAPMLAKTYLKDVKPEKVNWPQRGQRKLNGVRCLVEIVDGVVRLWSRRRLELLGVPHVQAAYEKAFNGVKGHFIVDGELYRHGWSLQKISGYTRKKEPKDGYLELKHYVYDLPICVAGVDRIWSVRENDIEWLFRGPLANTPETVKVETVEVTGPEHADELIHAFMRERYEGLILRDPNCPYEPDARSYGLLKFKLWIDLEFPIVAVNEGRGKFEGLAMFTCHTVEGRDPKAPVVFDVCAPGSFEEREEHLKNAANLIGKQVTVKFFEFTDDGSLEFPVPVTVRDYE